MNDVTTKAYDITERLLEECKRELSQEVHTLDEELMIVDIQFQEICYDNALHGWDNVTYNKENVKKYLLESAKRKENELTEEDYIHIMEYILEYKDLKIDNDDKIIYYPPEVSWKDREKNKEVFDSNEQLYKAKYESQLIPALQKEYLIVNLLEGGLNPIICEKLANIDGNFKKEYDRLLLDYCGTELDY